MLDIGQVISMTGITLLWMGPLQPQFRDAAGT
jgi:hypothetical protein